MRTGPLKKFTLVVGLVVFVMAVWALRQILREVRLEDLIRDLHEIPARRVVAAMILTAISYLLLTAYDYLAFRYIGKPLAYRRIALGSFLGYVFSHTVGLSLFSGSAARYRIYSTWGVTAAQTVTVALFCAVTFALGFVVLGGAVLLVEPASLRIFPRLPQAWAAPVGAVLLLIGLSYVALAALRPGRVLRQGGRMKVPTLGTAVAQVVLSSADWVVAAGVLYLLLPRGQGPFLQFVPVYMLAQAAALVSHVPGGLGVIESIVLALLTPMVPVSSVLGALLVFRVIYYVGPFLLGLILLAIHDLTHRLTRRRSPERSIP